MESDYYNSRIMIGVSFLGTSVITHDTNPSKYSSVIQPASHICMQYRTINIDCIQRRISSAIAYWVRRRRKRDASREQQTSRINPHIFTKVELHLRDGYVMSTALTQIDWHDSHRCVGIPIDADESDPQFTDDGSDRRHSFGPCRTTA
jgi:hypothetical protein